MCMKIARDQCFANRPKNVCNDVDRTTIIVLQRRGQDNIVLYCNDVDKTIQMSAMTRTRLQTNVLQRRGRDNENLCCNDLGQDNKKCVCNDVDKSTTKFFMTSPFTS